MILLQAQGRPGVVGRVHVDRGAGRQQGVGRTVLPLHEAVDHQEVGARGQAFGLDAFEAVHRPDWSRQATGSQASSRKRSRSLLTECS